MNKGQLKAIARLKLQDNVVPYLWPDEELDSNINEAQNEAAVRNRLIFDKTSAICSFQTEAGAGEYAISPLFFRLKRVTVDGKPLSPITRETIDCEYRNEPPARKPHSYFLDEDGMLRLFPAADAVYTIGLEGYRYPNEMVDDEDEAEIPEKYQKKMLSWAYKLCKEKEDPETERAGDAARHEADFERVFGPQKNANQIRQQAQVRQPTMRYGGL